MHTIFTVAPKCIKAVFNTMGDLVALMTLYKDDLIATVCLPWTNIFIFAFYVLIGMLLKGMVESSLLSKYEPLTPNIDRVVAL